MKGKRRKEKISCTTRMSGSPLPKTYSRASVRLSARRADTTCAERRREMATQNVHTSCLVSITFIQGSRLFKDFPSPLKCRDTTLPRSGYFQKGLYRVGRLTRLNGPAPIARKSDAAVRTDPAGVLPLPGRPPRGRHPLQLCPALRRPHRAQPGKPAEIGRA